MTGVRAFLLATCLLTLGVPALQAQNSPAQDMLPQVEESQPQQSPVQEMMPQDAPEQEPKVQESPARDAQADEDHGAMPQGSSAPVATTRRGSIATPEKASSKDKKNNDKPVKPEALTNPVIWKDPGDISSKDLFWGQGGQQRRPRPSFTFIGEVLTGTSPKFDCRDARGKKWRVKLGKEARPEVVASRLLWAVGYFVDDAYLVPEAQVRGLKMERTSGKQKGTTIIDARFKRKPPGQQKIGIWKWQDNPFFGTREFNGLRVMMAVMNNWDLKSSNTAVYEARDRQQQYFLVSDVGSSFGKHTIKFPLTNPKSNTPGSYERSKFIVRNDGAAVDFATPDWPKDILARSVGTTAMAFSEYGRMDWIGKNIPVPDAHWIGTLLGQLSHRQLMDAFRAGNFPQSEVERYVTVLESRIRELQGL